MENLIIDGAKLQDGNEADLSKIKGVITEFNKL
jgi:hypothetical protein